MYVVVMILKAEVSVAAFAEADVQKDYYDLQ
jgi:hypothetical protein